MKKNPPKTQLAEGSKTRPARPSPGFRRIGRRLREMVLLHADSKNPETVAAAQAWLKKLK